MVLLGLFAMALGLHGLVIRGVFVGEKPLLCSLSYDCTKDFTGADFYAVYHGAINIQGGTSPYSGEPDGVTPYFYAFRYLPGVAQAACHLTRLAPATARVAWCSFIEASLLIVLFLLWRVRGGAWRWLIGAMLALFSLPYVVELHMGQFTFVTVALLLMGLHLPSWLPLYGLGVALKPYTLIAAPALIRHRRLWPQLPLAVFLVLCASLPWFSVHPEDWELFWRTNFSELSLAYDSGNVGMVGLAFHLCKAWWGEPPIHVWNHALSIVRLSLMGFTCAVVLLSRERRVLLGSSALVLAHFLSYQHVWEHHMSAVVLLGAAVVATSERRDSYIPAIVVCLVVLAAPTFTELPRSIRYLPGGGALLSSELSTAILPSLSKAPAALGLYLIILLRHLASGLRLPGTVGWLG